MIGVLVAKGYAYCSTGMSITKSLSLRITASSRAENWKSYKPGPDRGQRSQTEPMDFALWKAAKPGDTT